MALFASLALVNALDGAGGKKSDPSDADQVLLRMLNLSVVNNITVWRELEQGNIETAKTALERGALLDAVGILEILDFERDGAVLSEQVGLRAAARHWAKKQPNLEDEAIARMVLDALAKVRQEMEKRKEPE